MFWMDVGDFEFILGKISHLISPCQMSDRLGSFQSLRFQFRISLNAASYIIKGCYNALVDELVPVFVKSPSSDEQE